MHPTADIARRIVGRVRENAGAWKLLAVAALLLFPVDALATKYRSRATGTWTANTTWDISTDGGSTWAPAGAGQFPSSTATDSVTIQAGHTVTMSGNPGNCRTLILNGTATWSQARTTNVGAAGLGDLVVSGGTLSGASTGTLNVQGGFSVPVGATADLQRVTLTVTGATQIDGDLTFTTSATGTKTFVGGVTVGSSGSWTNTINSPITFRGGLTNDSPSFSSGSGTHTFTTNSQAIGGTQPVVFTGTVAISGAVTVTNLGSVSIGGNLTGSVAGSTWLNSSGSSLTISGALLATGTLTATAAPNTVTYAGAAQTVKGTTYSNLILSGSGTKTTAGVTVLDTLSRQGTAAASAAPTYSERAVLEYRGTGAQTSGPEFPSPMSAAVLINNASGVTLNAAKTVNDSVIVLVGSLADGGFQITGNAADSLIVNAGATLILGSAGTATAFPTNFGVDLDQASTVAYNAGVAQAVSAVPSYGKLTIQGVGAKSTAASSTVTVRNTVTLAAGTFAPGAGSTIDVGGDWTNNGGTFTAGTSTIHFSNTATGQSINGSAASQSFNAIVVAKGGTSLSVGGSTTTLSTTSLTMNSGTFAVATSTTVNGALTLTGGTLSVGASTLTLNSTVSGTGTTITSSATGTVAYNQGSVGQAVRAASYGNLTFSNFNKTLPAAGTVGIAGTFVPGTATGHTITGSTVEYDGAGAQTIVPFTYNDLTISGPRGGATVTLGAGTVNVQGSLSATATSVVYSSAGNTVAFTGSSPQTSSAFTFNGLTMNNAAGLTLNGVGTVNGLLTLTSGTITTGPHKLTLSSSATVSRTAGHIVGAMEWAIPAGSPTRTFNIGTASAYVPVTVAFSGVSTGGTLSSQTVDGDHPNIGTSGLDPTKSVNRYWTLTNTGTVFDSANVTVNFVAGDIDAGATTSSFSLATYSGGVWTGQTVGSALPLSTTATGLTSFGDLQVGEPFSGVTYTWDHGAGTTQWNTAANWNPDGVPGASDIIIINTADTVEVQDSRSVNTATIDHPAARLLIRSTGSLSVAGNLNLTTGTLETRAAFPTVGSSVSITAGAVEFSGSGPQTIPAHDYVDLRSSSTGTRTLASSGTIGIAGVFTPGSNTYTVTGSTVEYKGPGAQTVVAFAYNNLTSSGSGARTLASSGTIGVAGTFTPGSNSYTVTGSTVDFTSAGSQTIPATSYNNLSNSGNGARTLASSGTISVMGVFTPGSGTYTTTGSTVEFAGSGSQTIPAIAYDNLTSSGSGARTLASSGTIGVAGTFTPGSNSYTVAGSTVDFTSAGSQTIPATSYNDLSNSGNGARTLASSGTISVIGVFTPGSGTYTTTGSTVEFAGSGSQTIPAIAYDNLSSSGSGARTLASSGTIGVAGTFTPGSNSYTVAGSSVDFNAAGAQSIPPFTFNNLAISGARGGATVTLGAGTISAAGTVAATATGVTYDATGNTFDYSSAGSQTIAAIEYGDLANSGNGNRTLSSTGTIGISGSLTAGTGNYTTTGSTVAFHGTAAQVAPSFSYNNLTVDNGAGVTFGGASTVNGTLLLTSGTLTMATDTLSIGTAGSVSRTAGWVNGPLKKRIPTGATARTFEVGDASGYTPVDVAFASVTTAGDLAVSTAAGDHADVANSGVNAALSANRTWSLVGTGVAFTTYSVTVTFLNADLDLGADPTVFVMGLYDGAAWTQPTVGTLTSTSTQATGVAGFGTIQVGQSSAGTFTSTAAGGPWSAGSTWIGGVVPTAGADIVIATTGSDSVTVDVTPANVSSLVINSGSTLAGGGAFTLSLNRATGTNFINNGTFNANGVTVRLARNSTWNGSGVFNLSSINLNGRTLTLGFTSPQTIELDGAGTPLSATGTFVPGLYSTILFDGTAAQTLNVTDHNFRNVAVRNAAGVSLNAAMTTANVLGNVSVLAGTLDNAGFGMNGNPGATLQLSAGGTLVLGGTTAFPTGFTPSLDDSSTVSYSGTTQIIKAQQYGGLDLATSGTKTFQAGTTLIAGDLTVGLATVDATTNLTTIEFNGTGPQSFAGLGYYALTFSGAGTKTLNAAASAANGVSIQAGATLSLGSSGVLNVTTGDLLNLGALLNAGTLTVTGTLDNEGTVTNSGSIIAN